MSHIKNLPAANDVPYAQSKAANRYEGDHTISVNGAVRTMTVAFNDDEEFYHWFYFFDNAPETHCGNCFYFSASAFFEGCRDTTRD